MLGDAQPAVDAQSGGASRKIRVRTPGKHIVLFALAATFMLAASTAVISRTGVARPERAGANIGLSAKGAVEETFLVDLSPDAEGRRRFLKMTVSIEASGKIALQAIEDKRATLRERVSFFLRELSPEDFEGSAAQARLKAEMLKRVNLSLGSAPASDVVVSSLVIQ